MKKRFKKVVKWEGEYDYKSICSMLIAVNIAMNLVMIFVYCLPGAPLKKVWQSFLILAVANILIALLGFIDKVRKVYWEEE